MFEKWGILLRMLYEAANDYSMQILPLKNLKKIIESSYLKNMF